MEEENVDIEESIDEDVDTDTDVEEDIDVEEDADVNTEIEDKARRMGWVKEDNFKGDKDRWISAEKFLERGETELPIMRERMKKLDGTVVGLKKTISSMKKTFGDFREYQKGLSEKAYAKALKDITQKQRVAAEDGDLETFDKMEEEKGNLTLDIPVYENNEKSESEREFDDWLTDNKWFNKNKKLRNYAAKMSEIISEETGLTGIELYNEVKAETKERYPNEFKGETPRNRKKATMVVADGETKPVGKKQTFGNLPASAKKACGRFIKEIPGFTKEEFLKNYEW